MKYKGSILRRGVLAGAIVLAGGSAASLAASPAGASNTQMTAVGSFTTFFMMHALFPQLNDINPNPETGSGTQSIAVGLSDVFGWSHLQHDDPAAQRVRPGKDGAGGRRNGCCHLARVHRLLAVVVTPGPPQ